MNERGDEAGRPRGGVFQAMAEPLLATIAAATLTLLLTVPFLPTEVDAEVALRAAGAGTELPAPELAERVRHLGLARSVEIVLKNGSTRLVLHDVAEGAGDVNDQLRPALRSAGYLEREAESTQAFSFERLLDLDPRTLPALMTIQALAFLVTGAVLAGLRVRRAPPARTSWPRALAAGVAGGIVALVASTAISRGLSALGIPVEEQEWVTRLFQDRLALAWLTPWIVFVGPLSEEVFFRRYAYRAIAARAGIPAGMLVSSAMFAMIHFNPSGFLVYLAIGVVLSWVYERTGRFVAPLAGHVTVNAAVLAAAVIPGWL